MGEAGAAQQLWGDPDAEGYAAAREVEALIRQAAPETAAEAQLDRGERFPPRNRHRIRGQVRRSDLDSILLDHDSFSRLPDGVAAAAGLTREPAGWAGGGRCGRG